jgi:integrase
MLLTSKFPLMERNMALRKREWTRDDGSISTAWQIEYRAFDARQNKVRRFTETFDRMADAKAALEKAKVDVRQGLHTPVNKGMTLADAAALYIQTCKARNASGELERNTVKSYSNEIRHLLEVAGHRPLAQIVAGSVRDIENALRAKENQLGEKFSGGYVRRCLRVLGSIFTDAIERGNIGHNPTKDIARKRRKQGERQSGRDKGKLKVGRDIPTLDEVLAIIEAATTPYWKVFLMTSAFTGLRPNEMRALRWANVDLDKGEVHVTESADPYGKIGSPKTACGNRTVPLGRPLVAALRAHKNNLRGDPELVFPPLKKKAPALSQSTIRAMGLIPAVRAAGLVTADGNVKYSSIYTFRHFYASWCLGPKADGGLELQPKVVSERMGHSNISITLNVYAHLLPQVSNKAMDDAMDKLFTLKPVVAS